MYLSKEFARQARRGAVSDEALLEAAARAEAGAIDADLGGHLIKQRVARSGKGRSGGFRAIIAYWRGERAIFLHLFAKAHQAKIGPVELEALQKLARLYDGLADELLDALVTSRGWRKVEKTDGEEEDVSQ